MLDDQWSFMNHQAHKRREEPMELKRISALSLLAGFFLLGGPLTAAEGSIYGHISFIDNGAMVLRAEGGEDQAVVNLPVAPGDTVITPAGGRCELQFDNGTVVRLDKGSRLRLVTVLAPSLTSNWEITTLELEEGQIYALPQSYSREMFQVVTPSAAVNLKSRVRATIRLDADGGTSFFSDGGKFQLLYGADNHSLKKATVKAGRPLAITATHVPAERVEKRDIEFMAWNEYVDRHFDELHLGISKVPPKLKLGNSALVYWAEKWSSLYGEWVYDELFGYVWEPADERFAFAVCPFFHADFVRINGQLFLVPEQPWGWLPAHMGTWVWMKRGWTWIPGNWFHPGIIDFHGTYIFPTFGYYWNLFHSNWYPRPAGEPRWENRPYKKPGLPVLPDRVISLVKKVAKASNGNDSKRLAVEQALSAIDGGKVPPVPRVQAPVPHAAVTSNPLPVRESDKAAGKPGDFGLKRDWNPDSYWATGNGLSIRYSSSRNTVVCPELKISSDRFKGVDRMILRGTANRQNSGTSSSQATLSQPSNNSSGSVNEATRAHPAGGGEHAKEEDHNGK